MSFLVNLVLEGRPALVVGAGAIAARKVRDLLAGGAQISVVAPEVCAEIEDLARSASVTLLRRSYERQDLRGMFVVVAATNDEELNASVSQDARALGILVNVVDRPALCTFTLPAVVRRGDLTLAVATDGRCPAFSSALKEELESSYGPEYADALDLLAELRREMMARGWSSPQIQQAIAGIYRAGLMERIASRDCSGVAALLRDRLGEEFPAPRWLAERSEPPMNADERR
jgi:precorrin-2 dehydrogenase/sirohydrochlorin ferrochelatase